jgi:multicomponent K+:H+ antiporter subunit D
VGVHYVVLNLVASGLFLIGLSLVYAATGTLNMADVGQRLAQCWHPLKRPESNAGTP